MPLSGVFCAAAALTLVKGDEGVELLEKPCDSLLLLVVGGDNEPRRKEIIRRDVEQAVVSGSLCCYCLNAFVPSICFVICGQEIRI